MVHLPSLPYPTFPTIVINVNATRRAPHRDDLSTLAFSESFPQLPFRSVQRYLQNLAGSRTLRAQPWLPHETACPPRPGPTNPPPSLHRREDRGSGKGSLGHPAGIACQRHRRLDDGSLVRLRMWGRGPFSIDAAPFSFPACYCVALFFFSLFAPTRPGVGWEPRLLLTTKKSLGGWDSCPLSGAGDNHFLLCHGTLHCARCCDR